MDNLYFYITGFLTGTFFILFLYYYFANRKIKNRISEQSEKLQKLIDYKESKTRYADFMWDGFYETSKPLETYSVLFNLKQVGRSETNPNLFKFEVISILSQQKNDRWGLKEYSDYFYKKNGGWLNISQFKKEFNWIVSKTKEELRDSKIDDILGTNQTD